VNDLDELKEDLRDLVLSGKKDQAIQILQDKYNVTPTEAQKLLALALKESITPEQIFKSVFKWTPRIKKALFKFVAIMFGIIGIPILIAAVGVYVYMTYQIKNSIYTTGVVTEIPNYTREGYYSSGSPVISYEFDTETYTTTASVFSNNEEFSLGDTVALYVNLDDPTSVIIDTFNQRWLMVIVIGAIGLSLTLSMLVLLIHSKRVPDRSDTT
jgi:hypothetical protein